MIIKPVLQALILAERVFTDVETKQKVISGTFTGLTVKRPKEVTGGDGEVAAYELALPIAGSPYVYISLTDVCDNTTLELQFVSLNHNTVLFGTTINLRSKDRLQTIEIAAPLPPLPITEPGHYAFEIVCGGEILGSYRIIARVEE